MREPLPGPVPLTEPDDAWSRAWGTPALQDLGRYLVATGSTAENAALLVEQTWIFYSYEVLPTLQQQTPMVIAVGGSHKRPRIQFTLLISTAVGSDFTAVDDGFASIQYRSDKTDLQYALTHRFMSHASRSLKRKLSTDSCSVRRTSVSERGLQSSER